jgi:hypothetical protein
MNPQIKARAFFFHFNKPASMAAKKVVISVHWKGKCLLCDNIQIEVPTRGRLRKTQPRFVVVGKGVVRLTDGVAIITAT